MSRAIDAMTVTTFQKPIKIEIKAVEGSILFKLLMKIVEFDIILKAI
jgi:hypothetical protein